MRDHVAFAGKQQRTSNRDKIERTESSLQQLNWNSAAFWTYCLTCSSLYMGTIRSSYGCGRGVACPLVMFRLSQPTSAMAVNKQVWISLILLSGLALMKTSGCHFRKSYQNVSKSIRFISKKECDFAESKNLINLVKISILPKRKTHCENPYKTCRLWRLLGAISAKVTQKYQKSIRFISKKECDFAESKNLIKPCKNQYFTRTENALWKPL